LNIRISVSHPVYQHGCEKSLLAGHETFISFLKPFDGLIFGDPVVFANTRLPRLPLAHPAARTSQNDEKVHAVNSSGRILFDTEIDVLVNSESKAASHRLV
jgi:hypothetical protein